MIWDDGDSYAMRFGLTDWEIFHAVWAEVWRETRLTPPIPRVIRTPWDKSRKGRPLVLPLPREGIGVGSPTPHTTHILTH